MNKTLTKILLSTLLLTSFTYGEVGDVPDAPVEDHQFTLPPVGQDEGTPLVGDDPLNEEEFERGDHYDINIGVATIDKEIGVNGQEILKDLDGNIIISPPDKATDLSTDYEGNIKFMQESYYKNTIVYKNATVEEQEAMAADHKDKLAQAKEYKRTEMVRKEYNQANNEKLFLKGLQTAGKGGGVATQMLVHKEGETEAEANVTNFYQQNYTSRPYHNSNLKLRESNAGILIEAYDKVDDIEAEAKAHLDAIAIRCYISRDLIPAFYCPISGQQDVKYPDFSGGSENARLLSSEEAEKTCNADCRTKQLCKAEQVITNSLVPYDTLSGKKIYPSREQNLGLYSLPLDDTVSTKYLRFEVNIHPSENFDGNATEFDEYIRRNGTFLKYKYSLFNRPTDTRLLPEVIVNTPTLTLTQVKTKLTIPIFRQTDRLVLQTYQPYVYAADVWSYQKVGEEEFLANIGSVTLDLIEAEYNGDSLFFCPARQFVPNAQACPRGVKQYTIGGQLYYICLDDEHMIGEDRNTGGFFTENACENACYTRMDCKPTYDHYTDLSNKVELFKAKVGCVQEDTNIGCQDDICEDLFRRTELIPQQELVIETDNVRTETVANYQLTDTPRPKIDIDAELGSLTESEYEEVFKKEMKDAAYKSMIEKQTFNRIKYPIGNVSPEQVAHIKTSTSRGTGIRGRLKPSSDKFDTGLEYSIYSVMRVEEIFPAIYGKYTRPGFDGNPSKVVDASEDVVIFKDISYLIKTTTGWELFKQILFHSIKGISPYIMCPKEAAIKYDGDPDDPQLSEEQKAKGCYIMLKKEWIQLPSYQKDNNMKYNEALQRFETYATTESAPYFLKQELLSNSPIKEFDLAYSVEEVAETVPGCFIRDQITEDLGVSMTRVFDTGVAYNGQARGRIGNMQIYLFSGRNLTYQYILDNSLEDKNEIFNYINQLQSPRYIENDGEIHNKIEPHILGLPDRSTLSVKITPNLDEEHKRVFKFIFLFNESPDPDTPVP